MTKVRAHDALISSNRARKLKFECPVDGHDLDFDYKLNQFGRYEWFYNCAACSSRMSHNEFNAALRDHDVWPYKLKSGDFSELRPLGPVFEAGDEAPLPTLGHIGGWASALTSTDNAWRYLTRERGLLPETIKQYEIGWDRDLRVVTLPVYDAAGQIVNLRRRKLGRGQPFKGLRGRGTQLFPASAITGSGSLVVCEGEFDCLVLNQLGIRAVTGTGGAGHWRPEWTDALRGHHVAVMLDVDAEPLAERRAAEFRAAGVSAFPVHLSRERFGGKADVSDALVSEGKSAAWLRQLIRRERTAA